MNIVSATGFAALSADQKQEHRAKVGLRAQAILNQFWRDDDTPAALQALELEGWCDVLQEFSHGEIRQAWAQYQRSGPRTGAGKLYKPDAGAIYKIIKASRPRQITGRRLHPNLRDDGDGNVISASRAQEIIREIGFGAQRFGGQDV